MTTAALLVEARRLCSEAGLSPAICTDRLLEAALGKRGKALDLQPEALLPRLRADVTEQRELVEELLVRESWFWRDVRPFEWFCEWLRERGWPARGALRVLSAPCANGEEAYSILLAALSVGLRTTDVHVHGIDLSLHGLELARTGRYRSRALRSLPSQLKASYFAELPDGSFQLAPRQVAGVHFEHANLAEPGVVARGGPYHAVFCRNLLIYLDGPARARLLAEICSSLVEDGALVLGHAEAALVQGLPLSPVPDGACFAFLRHLPARSERPRPGLPITPPIPSRRRTAPVEARTLADAGRYREALEVAEALRMREPGVAEHEYLVGLLHSAMGDAGQARRAYQRALYLDPAHGPSREQLSLLLEAGGESERAARLRRNLPGREDAR